MLSQTRWLPGSAEGAHFGRLRGLYPHRLGTSRSTWNDKLRGRAARAALMLAALALAVVAVVALVAGFLVELAVAERCSRGR